MEPSYSFLMAMLLPAAFTFNFIEKQQGNHSSLGNFVS